MPFSAQRVGQAELLQMDTRHIPYQGEFDVVGAFDVLEHIEEDEDVLREINRALVLGGCLPCRNTPSCGAVPMRPAMCVATALAN